MRVTWRQSIEKCYEMRSASVAKRNEIMTRFIILYLRDATKLILGL
jgi:hypothetical protein